MTDDFRRWGAQVRRLFVAWENLEARVESLGLAPEREAEWRSLLEHKLLPQATGEPWLIAAVVGGTNIGKSAVFNHLAGEVASAVSPLASGTKHPVCLVPPGFAEPELLARLFPGFELIPWHDPDQAQVASDEHRLFWREGRNLPPGLVILDSPDIDSDAEVNWQRADQIRQTADVLIGVLTQQKYNDATVKRFFRKAAEAAQPIVVVFNQCDLTLDREAWPTWLATFCGETGARPPWVYVCPYDRPAALAGKLPFYPVGAEGREPPGAARTLRDDLATLEFSRIKLQTLQGAMSRVLDPARGAPATLDRWRRQAAEFQEAAEALSTEQLVHAYWPALPARRLVDEVRLWWDEQRSPWSRRVHGFYRTVGDKLLVPVRAAWQAVAGAPAEDDASFALAERGVVVRAVEDLLAQLERLARLGNATLRPRLEARLGGDARAQLLSRIQASHAELVPIDDDYRRFIQSELDRWSRDNERAVAWLRSLDHVSAFARPAITVTLAVSGWVVAGNLVHEAAVQAAAHTAGQLATEAAITGGIAGGGEVLVGTTGEGLRRAAGQLFRRLQDRYAQERAQWLAGWLERELLGDLLRELRAGAELPASEPYREAVAALGALRQA